MFITCIVYLAKYQSITSVYAYQYTMFIVTIHVRILLHMPQLFIMCILQCIQGLAPTVAKSMVATSITFVAYEAAKDFLKQRRETAAGKEL